MVFISVAGLLMLACICGSTWIYDQSRYLTTNNAFVSGNLTYVSSRVSSVVMEVLVNNNDYVQAGDLLVRLDPQVYALTAEKKRAALAEARLQAAQQTAAYHAAQADLEVIQRRIEGQLAELRGHLASLKLRKANLALAQKEYDRVALLVKRQAASSQELDRKLAAVQAAKEQVVLAQNTVHQCRAALGLPNESDPLSGLPEAVGQRAVPPEEPLKALVSSASASAFPALRAAQARVERALAALGGAAFDPAKLDNHPSILDAQKELEAAELQLSFTELRAPISGFVAKRSVHTGNYAVPGQSLLTICRPASGRSCRQRQAAAALPTLVTTPGPLPYREPVPKQVRSLRHRATNPAGGLSCPAPIPRADGTRIEGLAAANPRPRAGP
jgi:membrane fusion protein (multidrug efflux system)